MAAKKFFVNFQRMTPWHNYDQFEFIEKPDPGSGYEKI